MKPITIREVFETRSEEKRQFFQRMVERSRANLERWTDEQHELALIAAEQKKKRLDDLALQLKDVKERKIRERKLNVEMELKYLREAEKLEEQRMLSDNINLRKRIEYYQELSDMINENERLKNKDKDWKKKLALDIPATPTSATSSYGLPAQQQTPASTAGTDFESCFGDEDDQASDYEECISDDFVEKFAENEQDLNAICDSKSNIVTQQNEALSESVKSVAMEREENANVIKNTMKRSDSDYLNSNESHSINTLQENRRKAMSSSNMDQCVKTFEVADKTMKTNANHNELNNASTLISKPEIQGNSEIFL